MGWWLVHAQEAAGSRRAVLACFGAMFRTDELLLSFIRECAEPFGQILTVSCSEVMQFSISRCSPMPHSVNGVPSWECGCPSQMACQPRYGLSRHARCQNAKCAEHLN